MLLFILLFVILFLIVYISTRSEQPIDIILKPVDQVKKTPEEDVLRCLNEYGVNCRSFDHYEEDEL